MRLGFTARQVMHLTGVPYSTLNLWAKNGLVEPSISPAAGTGTERIYSFGDLIALKVALTLRKAGVSTGSLKKVVEYLRESEGLQKPLTEARLVVSGRDVIVVKNQKDLVSALSTPGQSCLSFVVDLPRSIGELINIAQSHEAVGLAVLPDAPVPRHKEPKATRGSSSGSSRKAIAK